MSSASQPQIHGIAEEAGITSVAMRPLFFVDPHVITVDRHANARLRNNMDFAFARQTNSIPLASADLMEAAKLYPIVFTTSAQAVPVALVGFEQENYLIDENNRWREGYYVPAYVRKYPFVFMESPGSDQLTLCVDDVALTKDSNAGPALYDENRQPSEYTNGVLKFCISYHEQMMHARELGKQLQEKGLLTTQRLQIELPGGKKMELAGFQMIDREKFAALGDDVLMDWHKRQLLPLVYYIIQSQSNWRVLLELANKYKAPAGALASVAPIAKEATVKEEPVAVASVPVVESAAPEAAQLQADEPAQPLTSIAEPELMRPQEQKPAQQPVFDDTQPESKDENPQPDRPKPTGNDNLW
jgi:hypothetical protein